MWYRWSVIVYSTIKSCYMATTDCVSEMQTKHEMEICNVMRLSSPDDVY